MRHQRRQSHGTAEAMASSLRRRNNFCGTLLAAACLAGAATIAHAEEGKALFEAKCGVCHNIGGGPKVGPDLKEVFAKRGKDGMVAAVLDPAKAGLKPTMPNLGLPKTEVELIVAYVQTHAGAGPAAGKEAAPAPAQAAAAAPPHPDEIQRGQDLFQGKVRFANGGPSCNACHHVKSDALLGGGVLATELSLVFSRMGKEGVSAILTGNPFPVMQAAYKGKAFSEQEINALVTFLQRIDQEHARQLPKEWGWRMFSAGVGGVIVLVGILSLAGRRRKKACVNQEIYDRQIASE